MEKRLAWLQKFTSKALTLVTVYLVNVFWPALKTHGPPVSKAVAKGLFHFSTAAATGLLHAARILVLPITVAVLTIMVSTVVGQLLLASAAIWIGINIFGFDPLPFLRNEERDVIELPAAMEWVTPDFLEKLLKEQPERLLELLDIFAG